MNNLSGCSFNCEDHFPIHIFIRSSKYESFHIFPEVTVVMVDHNVVHHCVICQGALCRISFRCGTLMLWCLI